MDFSDWGEKHEKYVSSSNLAIYVISRKKRKNFMGIQDAL